MIRTKNAPALLIDAAKFVHSRQERGGCAALARAASSDYANHIVHVEAIVAFRYLMPIGHDELIGGLWWNPEEREPRILGLCLAACIAADTLGVNSTFNTEKP